MTYFGLSGVAQVSAKACTSLALANGVSFPIVTLAKAGKSFPVMLASLLVGKTNYTLQEYFSCIAIIGGTCLVSSGSQHSSKTASTALGLTFIALSLFCDGLTGGVQQRMKKELGARGLRPEPYDFMLFTNLFMMLTALVVAAALGDFQAGRAFCASHPSIFVKILKFAACSAIGQSFIFYTISTFDPYICSTITTTRKMFSVLLSIFIHGVTLSPTGWSGIALASLGIVLELQKEAGKTSPHKELDSDHKKG